MRIAAALALLASLAVSACGFTPMYAEPAVGSSLRRIAVTTQDDRLGYRLREQLEDVLAWDRGATPLYRLATEVQQNRRSLGRRNHVKKAYVCLKAGQELNFSGEGA